MFKETKIIIVSIITISILIGLGTGFVQLMLSPIDEVENGFTKAYLYLIGMVVTSIVGSVITSRIRPMENMTKNE